MAEHVRVEITQGVLSATLSRPEKRNALTDAMYGALADAVERADSDKQVRALLLRADGAMFTAGNDIADFANSGSGEREERQVHRFLRALATCSCPIVVAVQGRAVGVGTTMLLHCDVVVLAEDAILSTPFVNLALVPEAASSVLLPQRIGHVRAFEMMALGRLVDARDALAWGLASSVVPTDELQVRASDFARRLASQPPAAVRATKQLMRSPAPLLEQMEKEGEFFSVQLRSPEAKEAFAAFSEKRAPNYF